eukprot:3130514-Rhodomonas_salina.1
MLSHLPIFRPPSISPSSLCQYLSSCATAGTVHSCLLLRCMGSTPPTVLRSCELLFSTEMGYAGTRLIGFLFVFVYSVLKREQVREREVGWGGVGWGGCRSREAVREAGRQEDREAGKAR